MRRLINEYSNIKDIHRVALKLENEKTMKEEEYQWLVNGCRIKEEWLFGGFDNITYTSELSTTPWTKIKRRSAKSRRLLKNFSWKSGIYSPRNRTNSITAFFPIMTSIISWKTVSRRHSRCSRNSPKIKTNIRLSKSTTFCRTSKILYKTMRRRGSDQKCSPAWDRTLQKERRVFTKRNDKNYSN